MTLNKFFAAALASFAVFSSAFAAPITSTLDPALNGATVQDFSTVAGGSYTTLALPGFTINATTGSIIICDHCGGYGYGDTGNSLNNQAGNNFEFVFGSTVSAFGISGGAFNAPWTYSAYDSANQLIEAISVNVSCCGPAFRGIAANGIKRVTFTTSGDWVVFDDMKFVNQASQVPEPGSLALLGLGLLAGFAASRRNKKA